MKKLAVLFLAIIILLCAVSSAIAANWLELGRNERFLYSFDIDSIQQVGTTIRVWEKWIYRNEEDIKKLSKVNKGKVAYSVQYFEYDVNNRTFSNLGSTYYDKNGNSLKSFGVLSQKELIPPGSVGEFKINFYKALLKIE